MEFGLYAAKTYVTKTKASNWEFIASDKQYDSMPQQKWLRAFSKDRSIVCRIGDITAQYLAARSGAGVAILPCFLPSPSDNLVRLDVDVESLSREIWLVVHKDLKRSPLIRVVMDFTIEMIEKTPGLRLR